jgi:hypothetical protein
MSTNIVGVPYNDVHLQSNGTGVQADVAYRSVSTARNAASGSNERAGNTHVAECTTVINSAVCVRSGRWVLFALQNTGFETKATQASTLLLRAQYTAETMIQRRRAADDVWLNCAHAHSATLTFSL